MKVLKIKFNSILISAFVLTGLLLGSCKKLDTYPITAYSENNFWKHPNHASAALNGAYSLLQLALNTEFVYYGEGRADLLKLHVENNMQSLSVINNTMNVNMSFADWGNFYRVVQQCNLILKYVPLMLEQNIYQSTSAASLKEYNRIMGQAHALRALCYFYMIRIWGEVPLITEATEVIEDINALKTPRTPMDDIYTQIVTDLETARDFLADHTSYDAKLTRSHITRGGVDALFTDFYLWKGDVDRALTYAGNLVNDSGEPASSVYGYTALTGTTAAERYTSEYAQMFYNGYSKESIFEIAFNMDENSTSSLWGIYGGSGQAQFEASEIALSKLSAADPRRDVAFNTGSTKRYVQKFFEKDGSFDRTTMNDKNVIIYRLADICLLKAEALIKRGQGNDWQTALTLLNKIKQRAGVGQIGTEDFMIKTEEEAIEEVLEERARELSFEGKRWFDLVRNNKAIEVMQPLNGLSDPRNILWPINLGIIRQNPAIEQNEYYK